MSRWILFIFFWIVWLAMLVGAIVIVVMAPRCKAEPTPPWYQDTTVYEVNVEKFGGDLKGMFNSSLQQSIVAVQYFHSARCD